jgi:hypothetical protein
LTKNTLGGFAAWRITVQLFIFVSAEKTLKLTGMIQFIQNPNALRLQLASERG